MDILECVMDGMKVHVHHDIKAIHKVKLLLEARREGLGGLEEVERDLGRAEPFGCGFFCGLYIYMYI